MGAELSKRDACARTPAVHDNILKLKILRVVLPGKCVWFRYASAGSGT